MSLEPSEFAAYYQAVHGHAPFPWQSRLLERVWTDGWPSLLDLPTGSGKTSALDVALFTMALDAGRPPADRRAPRRVILVVDRRVVVNQAANHAKKIEEALGAATSGVLARVRDRLKTLSGDGPPLQVAELRGGVVRDDSWAHRPDVPLLAASTVDQVGSRLLFRGYGVGPKSASIHAGLLGNDTLFLLDEVHLSEPFRQTLGAIGAHFRPKSSLPQRFCVVEMSATPGRAVELPFGLEVADRAHPVLARRLESSKQAELCDVPAKGGEEGGRKALAAAAAQGVQQLLAAGHRRVGVVVNRVDTARRVACLLAASPAAAAQSVQVDLVTGRMRPVERDEWLRNTSHKLTFEGRGQGVPLVVVATQCIEAGADFDFDALVTECASLDALRQRFGRLNRSGDHPAVRAMILMRSDLAKSDEDPVYGAALKNTWAWLKAQEADLGAPPDFGIQVMNRRVPALGPGLEHLVTQRADAPVLLPGHLDLWAHTSQKPFPDPDPAPFLHGPQRGEPEVTVVWRADLVDGGTEQAIAEQLTAVPPAAAESLSLPLRAVAAWLSSGAAPDLSDLEGAEVSDEPAEGDGDRRAFRWSSDEDDETANRWVGADALRPGDVLVVPATRGGLLQGNWDPTNTDPVVDRGDEVQLSVRGWRVRRLHREVLSSGLRALPSAGDGDEVAAVEGWLAGDDARALAEADPGLAWFVEQPVSAWRVISTGLGLVVRARRREKRGTDDATSTGQGDRSSHLGVAVLLDVHLADVGRWAGKLARNVGLPETLAADVELAGRLHDLGKADPRFQAKLSGGSPVRAVGAGALLAKSADGGVDRRAMDRASRRAGYPRGTRHELLSLALVQEVQALRAQATDWDLVLHLVASHHGWCRPFPPAVPDPAPVDVVVEVAGGPTLRRSSAHALASLDSGVADRFHRLQRAYGWWGLAWLEALLRLGDHRASQEEQDEYKEVRRG